MLHVDLGCGKITIPDVLPSLTDYNLLGDWCKKNSIDLVVIGPEAYLADGIVDALQGQGKIICAKHVGSRYLFPI